MLLHIFVLYHFDQAKCGSYCKHWLTTFIFIYIKFILLFIFYNLFLIILSLPLKSNLLY